MDASLIVALGAFLVPALLALVYLKDRGDRKQLQFVQKKQEAIYLLLQAKIASEAEILTLIAVYHKSNSPQSGWSPDEMAEFSEALATAHTVQDSLKKKLEEAHAIRVTASTLVYLEVLLGQCHQIKLLAEKNKDRADQLLDM